MSNVYFTEWEVDDNGDASRCVCYSDDDTEFNARIGRVCVYSDGEIDAVVFGDERLFDDEDGGGPEDPASIVSTERWLARVAAKRGATAVEETRRWFTFEEKALR